MRILLLILLPILSLGQNYSGYTKLQTTQPGELHRVCLFKQAAMQADYDDVRFCRNPNSSNVEDRKVFDYWLETAYADSAVFWLRAEPGEFYAIYGDPAAVSQSNIYNVFALTGWFGNDFSRGALYDVSKYYSYDSILSGNPNEYEAWPCAYTSPITGHIGVVYKWSENNTHGATPGGRVYFKKFNGTSWSTHVVSDPPGDEGCLGAAVVCVDSAGFEKWIVVFGKSVAGSDGSGDRIYETHSFDAGVTWSQEVMIGPDHYNHSGGLSYVAANGWILIPSHYDSSPNKEITIQYSRDQGQTWQWVEFPSPAGRYLNETTFMQLKDDAGVYTDTILAICRDENSPQSFHKFYVVIGDTTISVTTPVVNNFVDGVKNRPFMFRTEHDRIFCLYGTGIIRAQYSDNEGDTWTLLPYSIADGSKTSSQRTYPVVAVGQNGQVNSNGKVRIFWNKNHPFSSDVYQQFWDYDLQSLRTLSTGTYTDAVPRPMTTADGIKTSYNDTGVLSDPKALVSSWTRNGYLNPFTLVGRARSKQAANAAIGLKKDGEPASSYSNVISFHNQSNLVYARQNTDGWNKSVVQNDDQWYRYQIDWSDTSVKFYLDDIHLWTKLPTDGNGIPNWNGQPYINSRDQASNPLTYVEVDYMYTRPIVTPGCTVIETGSLNWQIIDNIVTSKP